MVMGMVAITYLLHGWENFIICAAIATLMTLIRFHMSRRINRRANSLIIEKGTSNVLDPSPQMETEPAPEVEVGSGAACPTPTATMY